ncbi:elongation factor [Perkinsela sp. CCAP 1560/4]|nr:elongation factor [Perkinsela sp. CCAP 1560/4]|eukprot:KNH04074.1 elongation factor [Perkinsela sp. CCAP 1560/4]
MLKQSGTLQSARNRVMDNKDQEKERGITILAKHTALIFPEGKRINLVDTPGHMDFGGEVERALQMVEGFLLLVDVNEGVRPGTRYVLRKALKLKLKPLIMINKVDRMLPNLMKNDNQSAENPDDESKIVTKVVEELQDLFLDVATDADQLDMTILYGSGRMGMASAVFPFNLRAGEVPSLGPLFKAIEQVIPPPKEVVSADDSSLQMLVGNVEDINDGASRIAIGRIFAGNIAVNQILGVALDNTGGKEVEKNDQDSLQLSAGKVTKIELICGVEKVSAQSAKFGDVARIYLSPLPNKVLAAGENLLPLRQCLIVGATLCSPKTPKAWPYIKPDLPSYSLIVLANTASWKGQEVEDKDKSRFSNIRDRLEKEALNNTSLRLENVPDRPNAIRIMGRGLLHLGVILEDLRREDYEFELLAPETVTKKDEDGNLLEPFEKVTIECKMVALGEIIPLLAHRHADLGECESVSQNGERVIQYCTMAARTISDLSLQIMKLTKGDAIYRQEFLGYLPYLKGIDTRRLNGAIVSVDDGYTTDYGLSLNKDKGNFFVRAGEYVHFGQIVGELNSKGTHMKQAQDMPLNITRIKESTNVRANAADAAKQTKSGFSSAMKSMEELLSWAASDEFVTVTPKSVRIRKQYFDGKTSRPKKH